MNRVRSILFTAAVLPIAFLTACQPADTVPPPPPVSPTPSSTTTPSSTAQQLPADAVLGLVGNVTSSDGAELSLSLVVHSPIAATDPAASSRVAAMVNWCTGEMDANQLAQQGYSLIQIDYTATQVGGASWPANALLAVFPTAQDVGLASSGAVHQIEVLTQPAQPGDYVPHCQQSAFLTAPGAGSTFVAIAGDATDSPPFTRWADFQFGFDAENTPTTLSTGNTSPMLATFTNCSVTVTAHGSSLGYPSATWAQEFTETRCIVGGATP